ncbi:hypothetical protein [Capnocytophaga canimorsus]|uniref:hypothetical protein n=1 Tax=Capnocytophaga canimorsus TaxID=28188 RepID=UPI000F507402|nr:hypothetical protein [Capnocytophaga canimorsus]MDT9499123.1 hypothetical protein [Capnocytophaga canimorsus]
MRKVFLLMLLISSNLCLGQESFQFKGIPISGSMDDFAKKIIQQGYKWQAPEEAYLFTGVFANEDCEIMLYEIEGTKDIEGVFVLIKRDDWSSMETLYYKFKDELSKKYGEPKSIEKFEYPYEKTDNNSYKWTAVKNGSVQFASIFDTDNGKILLRISQEGKLIITYSDKEARKRSEKIKSNNFSSDL